MSRHTQNAVVTVFGKLYRSWRPSSANRTRFILLLLVVIPALIPTPTNTLLDVVPKGLVRNPYYVGRPIAQEDSPVPLPGGSDEVVTKTATNGATAGICEAAEQRVSNKGTVSYPDGLKYSGAVHATNVVFQFAERNQGRDIQRIALVSLYASHGATRDFPGIHRWGGSESPLMDNLLANIAQLWGKWFTEEIHWGAGAIEYLAKRSFGPVVFLPVGSVVGIAQIRSAISCQQMEQRSFSALASQGIQTLCAVGLAYCGIVSLYLLGLKLYWKGHSIANIKHMVARLCATAALLVGCRLIVESNDVCRMLDVESNHCQPMLFCAMGVTFKCAVIAAGSFSHNIVGPLATLFGPVAVLSYVSSLMFFGELSMIWMSAAIMVAQLTCITLLRAAQTLLLLGQCVLVPFLLVSRSAPRSKRYGRLLIKSMLITFFWNISWFGLIQLQSVIVFADLPALAKIWLGIFVLQLMIFAPLTVSILVHRYLRHPHRSLTRSE